MSPTFVFSFNIPQSSILPYDLALSQTGVRRRIYGAITPACISTWCGTIREEWKRPLTTLKPGEWMTTVGKDNIKMILMTLKSDWVSQVQRHTHTLGRIYRLIHMQKNYLWRVLHGQLGKWKICQTRALILALNQTTANQDVLLSSGEKQMCSQVIDGYGWHDGSQQRR